MHAPNSKDLEIKKFSEIRIDADKISRIVRAFQNHSGSVTIKDLIEELGVSRLTLLKWLHRMEIDHIIKTTVKRSNTRGRPEVIYNLSSRPLQTIGNPSSTLFLTEVGRDEKDPGWYNILAKTLDFKGMNESIIELDQGILASSITDKLGNLKVGSVRRGYKDKIKLEAQELEKWAPWISVISALASHHDIILGEAEYVAIGRKRFKSLVIPFKRFGLIVYLIMDKTIEATRIYQMVVQLLKRLVSS